MPVFRYISTWFTDEPTPEPYLPGLNPDLSPPPEGYDSWMQYSIAEKGATLKDKTGKIITDKEIARGWDVGGMTDLDLGLDLLPDVAKEHFGQLKKQVYLIGGIIIAVLILK